MSRPGRPAPRPRGRGTPSPASKGTLRVVAGSLRGRRFDAPPGATTRPTGDRVRQATFNALESLGAVAGARVLDAFAGSGALGIEALSRGAAAAVFVDADPSALAVLRANLDALGLAPVADVRAGSGHSAAGGGPFDLVLLDPPYAFDGWEALLTDLRPDLAPEAVVVIESDREVPLPPGFGSLRCKAYGGTVVQFASPSGDPL